MKRLKATILRLTEEVHGELRHQARRRGTSLACLVREAVDQYLGRAAGGASPAFGDDPADAIIGSLSGSTGDESVNHDHYLYGWPKEDGGEAPGGHGRHPVADPPRRSQPRPRGSVPAKPSRGALRVDRPDPRGGGDAPSSPRRRRARGRRRA